MASGYFYGAEADKVCAELQALVSWAGVYVTLNPVDPALHARGASRLKAVSSATRDTEIVSRRRILVDFDPERPTGVSSTADEQQAAIERARAAREFLREELGWPDPMLADSGNGAHLVYGVELRAEDGLVKRALAALAEFFSDDLVTVDRSVGNAARICKLYGTLACKGDDVAERPHRVARIIEAPAMLECVPRERIERLVALAQGCAVNGDVEPPKQRGESGTTWATFDVGAFIRRNDIEVHYEGAYGDGARKWVLGRCPMDDSHELDRAAFIIQFPSGAIAAGCHHNRCQWGWRELRARFEPRALPAASSGSVGGAVPTDRAARIAPGMRVRSIDRGNIGTVASIEGSSATVRFASVTGAEALVVLPLAGLVPAANERGLDGAEARKYEFLSVSQIMTAEWPAFLVDGLLDRGELAVLYGVPASFKSFIALDLSLHVATGLSWSRCTTRQARVLYVAGEGQVGLRARLMAWLAHHGLQDVHVGSQGPEAMVELVNRGFVALGSGLPLLDPNEPANLLEQLSVAADRLGGPPELIVLDTLARCFLDGDENSSRDMGRFVEACDLMRKSTGATILVVHHTGKDGGQERGSSALRAGADAMFRVSRQDESDFAGTASLEVEKRKDAAHAAPLAFDLHRVDLGTRPDGRPLSSLVPVPSQVACDVRNQSGRPGRGRGALRPVTAHAQRVLILERLGSTFERGGASASKLIGDTAVSKASIYRRLHELEEEQLIHVEPRGTTKIYTISDLGRAWLSRGSAPTPRLREPETGPRVSGLTSLTCLTETETAGSLSCLTSLCSLTTPPLGGVRDETETETETIDPSEAAVARPDAAEPKGGAA